MPVELKQDSLNVIDLSDLGVSMQAIEDKIIILVDQYKSGFECKACGGTGKVASTIVKDSVRECSECGGKGQILHIPDSAKSVPSTGVVMSMGPKTEYMLAKSAKIKLQKEYDRLSGSMYADELTDTYEEDIAEAEEVLKAIPIQIGTRVVFGVHVGTPIPIKGSIRLTIMREKEPLCIVFGSDIGQKEIIDYKAEF